MTQNLDALTPIRCPICHRRLSFSNEGASCTSCMKLFPRHPDGFLDLRPNERRYQDWLSANDEAVAIWRSASAITEASGAEYMVSNYLIPLIHSLGFERQASILSVGCGGAWDVNKLQENGYHAWGVDNGGRILAWKKHVYIDYLALGDALSLPYNNDAFNWVFAEGVIEHIGYEGDITQQITNIDKTRQVFINELLRVTKPGGYILVGCPNRAFPIDFFHGGKTFHGFIYRFHSARESFLLSFKDIKKMYSSEIEWIKPLSLKNFFNLPRLAKDNPILSIPTLVANFVFGILPRIFWQSAFNPYIVTLAKKK